MRSNQKKLVVGRRGWGGESFMALGPDWKINQISTSSFPRIKFQILNAQRQSWNNSHNYFNHFRLTALTAGQSMYNPDFSQPWHFSDMVLSVEGTNFHVHRSTLSMWSPVFEKMFTSEFAEKDANEIALPGKKADEVEVLLKIVYSHGKAQQVTGSFLSPPPPTSPLALLFVLLSSMHSTI